MKTLWLALIAVFAAVTIGLSDADAKRLGGGRSVGKQAPNNVMQRDATPAAPAAAPAAPSAAQSAAAPRAAAAPGAAAATGGASRWLAPVAGLAAGLGLAALASHLGFGEELASIMTMVLLAVVALVAIRFVMSRRAASRQPTPAYAGAYKYTGLGQEASVPNYQPPVGGGSAQPIDVVRAAAAPVTGMHAPEGFDSDGFVRNAKVYFVRLQAAFDAGNTDDLREFTSPEMFAELKLEIDERNGAPNQTDVVKLEAGLLGVEAGPSEHMASVRFTGMLRERADAAAEPFDEVWNFTRAADGKTGWVLSGIQQLDRA